MECTQVHKHMFDNRKERELFQKKGQCTKRHNQKLLQCILTQDSISEKIYISSVINSKNSRSCGSNESGENISNFKRRNKCGEQYCGYIIVHYDQGNDHLTC